jgi:hypothetical protein
LKFYFDQKRLPNGWSYPQIGGMRQRQFDGTSFELRELLENAQPPTSRLHAVLGDLNLVLPRQ